MKQKRQPDPKKDGGEAWHTAGGTRTAGWQGGWGMDAQTSAHGGGTQRKRSWRRGKCVKICGQENGETGTVRPLPGKVVCQRESHHLFQVRESGGKAVKVLPELRARADEGPLGPRGSSHRDQTPVDVTVSEKSRRRASLTLYDRWTLLSSAQGCQPFHQ